MNEAKNKYEKALDTLPSYIVTDKDLQSVKRDAKGKPASIILEKYLPENNLQVSDKILLYALSDEAVVGVVTQIEFMPNKNENFFLQGENKTRTGAKAKILVKFE